MQRGAGETCEGIGSGIVNDTGNYIHAEARSAMFGFVDDVELQMLPSGDVIAIRSASRVGYSDMGVNRRRVERIRESLLKMGVIQ